MQKSSSNQKKGFHLCHLFVLSTRVVKPAAPVSGAPRHLPQGIGLASHPSHPDGAVEGSGGSTNSAQRRWVGRVGARLPLGPQSLLPWGGLAIEHLATRVGSTAHHRWFGWFQECLKYTTFQRQLACNAWFASLPRKRMAPYWAIAAWHKVSLDNPRHGAIQQRGCSTTHLGKTRCVSATLHSLLLCTENDWDSY